MSYRRDDDDDYESHYSSDTSFSSRRSGLTTDDEDIPLSPDKDELKEVIEMQRKELVSRTEMLEKARLTITNLQKENTDSLMNLSRISQITLGDERRETEELRRQVRDLEKLLDMKSEELSNQQARVREVTKKNQELRDEIEKQKQQIVEARQNNSHTSLLVPSSPISLHVRDSIDVDKLMREIHEKNLVLTETLAHLDTLQHELATSKLEREQFRDRAQKLDQMVKDLRTDKDSLFEQLSTLNQQILHNNSSQDIKQQEVNDQFMKTIKKLEEDKEHLRLQIDRLELMAKDREDSIRNETKREMLEKMASLQRQFFEADELRINYSQQLQELDRKIHLMELELSQQQNMVSERDRKISSLEVEVLQLSEKLGSLDAQKRNLEERILHIEDEKRGLELQLSKKSETVGFQDQEKQKMQLLLVQREKEIQVLESEVSHSKEVNSQIVKQKDMVIGQVSDLQEKMQTMESDLKELRRQTVEMEHKKKSLEGLQTLQQQTIQNLEFELSNIRKERDNTVKELQSKLQQVLEAKKNLELQISQHQERDHQSILETVSPQKISIPSATNTPVTAPKFSTKDNTPVINSLSVPSEHYEELKQKLMDQFLEHQQLLDQVKHAKRDANIIAELKKLLSVKHSHEISEACSRLMHHLERYVELFPKLQGMVDELCLTLNVSHLEEVVPSVKKLLLLTRGVEQWIQDNTCAISPIHPGHLSREEQEEILQDESIMLDIWKMQTGYSGIN